MALLFFSCGLILEIGLLCNREMEDEVAPSLSKTDLGKTEMDKDVVEEVPPLKAETNDETKVNDPTERPSPPEEQTEPLQQSSEDQEQMEVTQPNVDQETTSGELEQLNVKQEMSFEEQEQPSTHEELVIGEGDIPHVDQEQTQEEKEQKSRSQEQLLEQLSGDQGMITEEHLADQEEQVIGEQVHGDQTEPDIVQEQQSTSQEQPLELQEQLGGDPSSIIHKQSGQIVIQEEQVIREQVHLDHEQPITERKQVLDKQEQTFVFEEQSLAEDTVAASLQKNTRRTQNILEFQKTLSQDAINNATATGFVFILQ